MTPIQRFDAWRVSNQPLLWSLCKDHGEDFIRVEIKKARVWLMGAGESKAKRYKDWKRFFVSSWLKKAISERDFILGCMTAKQEEAYYASKKRYDGKSEFENIKDSDTSSDAPQP